MRPDFDTATNQAKALRNSNPLYKQARPIKFSALLADLGLKLQHASKEQTGHDEALLDPQKRVIWILDNDKPLSRKLFSIAHEIGHWMLHSRDKCRPRAPSYELLDAVGKIEEQEANAFAAELLMPYEEVARCIFWGYSVADLQRHFRVSYEFAQHRYNFVAIMEL
ncbi:ImmA/IrrE family metallo-endopeptidase [Helicobacter bizzozeronii]|uniref:ImmA/IrrE family metallo-endopeptidase n=1 Tax=Helicobacter bizzozeronii TaxID=56877 RepID=UPI000CF066BA|nr:ImmA/IrrE family metallo-endopeptidase [Helicobacter bizzozeronii]